MPVLIVPPLAHAQPSLCSLTSCDSTTGARRILLQPGYNGRASQMDLERLPQRSKRGRLPGMLTSQSADTSQCSHEH